MGIPLCVDVIDAHFIALSFALALAVRLGVKLHQLLQLTFAHLLKLLLRQNATLCDVTRTFDLLLTRHFRRF